MFGWMVVRIRPPIMVKTPITANSSVEDQPFSESV